MRKYIPILIILLLGCFAIFWSKANYIVSFGDMGFSQDRMSDFLRMFYTWDWISLGSPAFIMLSWPVPYGIYIAMTHLLTISSVHSQIFWNYLLFVSLGLSMYFLVIQLIQGSSKYGAGLLAAVFFMFNPWGAVNITMFIPFITFIPFVLGLYIRGLHNDKNFKYIVTISVIWCLISSFSVWNIRGFMFQWMILIFYLVFFCLRDRRRVRHALTFTIILFTLYILLNFYWILLFVLNIATTITGSAENYSFINYTRLDSLKVRSVTIPFSLRLLDDWSFTGNFKGIFFSPWLLYYQSPLLMFLGFFPILVALSSLLLVVKNKVRWHGDFIFFFLLLLFGLFISMGKNSAVILWCANHLPLFYTLFSLPSYYGGIFIAIGFSVLIGYGFMFACQHSKSSRMRISILLLSIGAIMFYGYPVWTGQFIPQGNRMLGAGQYQIPPYVFDLKKQSDKESLNYRIFPLPYSKLGYYAYNWPPGGFNGADPLINILSKPVVIGTGLGMQIADTTTQRIDVKTFLRMSSFLNVRYIMNKKDANLLHIKNNAWYTVPDPTFLNSLYREGAISSFGKIDLIKVPDDLFLPKLYTPLTIINEDNLNELPNIVSQKNYKTRSAIYFNNQNNSNATTDQTILEYRMINPTKYRVRVHSAQGTVPLVLSENFHEAWKVYLSSPDNLKFKISNFKLNPPIQGTIQNDSLPAGPIYETWFKKPISEDKNHLMVNGYANSWLIDSNRLCHPELVSGSKCIQNPDGSYDFELVIEFWQQRLYYLGLAISIVTFIGCIGYLLIKKRKT